MQRQIKRGTTAGPALIFHIFAMDSTSTSGAGKASVAFGSWTCYYIRNGEAISGAITPQDIATIGTYAAPTANTNIRIKAVDNTNMIGIYEVQIHQDWVNTTNSCQSLTIYLTAAGVVPLPVQIQLVGWDPQSDIPTSVADQVWDEVLAGHLGAGSTGAALNAAGSSADPWSTLLPGAYGAGTAGKIVGDNVNAPISSRLAPTVAGRTLDVAVTGEAGLDLDNIHQATGPTTLSNITVPTVLALDPSERTSIANANLDQANGIETGVTPRQAIRGLARTQLSKTNGFGGPNPIIRDLADTKDAVTATCDAVGNRSAVTVDWT